MSGMTMIYVTHYTEEIIDIFDHCLLLQEGKIYAKGNSNELLEQEHFSSFLDTSIEVEKIYQRHYVAIK